MSDKTGLKPQITANRTPLEIETDTMFNDAYILTGSTLLAKDAVIRYVLRQSALSKAPGEEIPHLKTALMNAVKPSYDIHIMCPSCQKEVKTDNGEWLIWCGEKHHAEAILEAAKRYLINSATAGE